MRIHLLQYIDRWCRPQLACEFYETPLPMGTRTPAPFKYNTSTLTYVPGTCERRTTHDTKQSRSRTDSKFLGNLYKYRLYIFRSISIDGAVHSWRANSTRRLSLWGLVLLLRTNIIRVRLRTYLVHARGGRHTTRNRARSRTD